MNENLFASLTVISNSITAICCFIASFFYLLECYQKEESKNIRDLLELKWQAIHLDKWLDLPIKAISIFVKLKTIPSHIYYAINCASTWKYIIIFIFAFLPYILISIHWHVDVIKLMGIVTPEATVSYGTIKYVACFLGIFMLLEYLTEKSFFKYRHKKVLKETLDKITSLILGIILSLYTIDFFSLSVEITPQLLENFTISSSSILLALVISLPILNAFSLLPPIAYLSGAIMTKEQKKIGKLDDTFMLLWITLFFSILGSLYALSWGEFVSSNTKNYFGIQMIISNYFFDFLTLSFSFYIFNKVLANELIIITAVIIDILSSAIFSVSSLFFGLIY